MSHSERATFTIITLIIFLLLILSVFFQDTVAQSDPPPIGDVSCDDISNSNDALYIVQFNVGLRSNIQECPLSNSSTEIVTQSCDVNNDSFCNSIDALLILQCDAGLSNQFCPSEPQISTIELTSPLTGEDEVAVTRETFIVFSYPLDESTVNGQTFSAQFGGETLTANVHLSTDKKRVTLFYDDYLPASARVRVTVDGDNILDQDGNAIDADGDGVYGGQALIDFDTLSLSSIPGTRVCDYVWDSYNTNPDGSNIPVIGATIRVDGMPSLDVVTDANGYFCLDNVPAPVFFVHIDGSTATSAPPGTTYARVGKPFHSVAGQEVELIMDGEPFDVFLPPVADGDIETLSTTEDTEVSFGLAGLNELGEIFPSVPITVWQETKIMVPPNVTMDEDGNLGTEVAIIPVDTQRLPGPLPLGIEHQLDIAVIAPGSTNFDVPVPACFPNLADQTTGLTPAPGEKRSLLSFNHDTGQWENAGVMTVSADGMLVCTDDGVGIRAPGWHGTGPLPVGPPSSPPQPIPQASPSPSPDTPTPTPEPGTSTPTPTAGPGTSTPTPTISPPTPTPPTCSSSIEIRVSPIEACTEDLFDDRVLPGFDLCGRVTYIRARLCFVPPGIEGAEIIDAILDLFGQIVVLYKGHPEFGITPLPPDIQDEIEMLIDEMEQISGSDDIDQFITDLATNLENEIQSRDINLGKVASYPIRYVAEFDLNDGSKSYFRSETGPFGQYELFAPANGTLRKVVFYDPIEKQLGIVTPFKINNPSSLLPHPYLVKINENYEDYDGDGLIDHAELVYGTDPTNPDSDGDNLSDGSEVHQGTDPLDGLVATNGIIGAVDLPNTASTICADNDIAIVGQGSNGLSIINIANGKSPVAIAQLDTPGEISDVACSGNLVAVADGSAGLTILDTTDPPAAFVSTQIPASVLGGNAQTVISSGNVIFVGLGSGDVVVVDLNSSTILDRIDLDGDIREIALSGDYLYALTTNSLKSILFTNGELALIDSVSVSGPRRLSVGATVAYITRINGYMTYDISDPSNLSLIAGASSPQAGWSQMVPNGSGLGIASVATFQPNDPRDILLYEIADPANTNNYQTQFDLDDPDSAQDIAIYNGLAYVAAGSGGLKVVNYIAYDAAEMAPSNVLTTSFGLTDVTEGQFVRATSIVTDDVQVRNVEFLVDGTVIDTDGTYPFETRFTTPNLIDQTTFTLQSRAIDTGGNIAATEIYTITLLPDMTPPELVRTAPQQEAGTWPIASVAGFFNEPLDPTSLISTTLYLVEAGTDDQFGTADDVSIATEIEWREEVLGAFLNVGSPLPAGDYRAFATTGITDLAGNNLGSDQFWSFKVFDLGVDQDLDGVPDDVEVAMGLDPTNPDTDGDGTFDGEEDPDNDGATTFQEIALGTDPQLPDSDNNGILDGDEDRDKDGLSDVDELFVHGTDINHYDTDGDGFNDKDEIDDQSNPSNAFSLPISLNSGNSVSVLNNASPGTAEGSANNKPVSVQNTAPPGIVAQDTTSSPISVQNEAPPGIFEEDVFGPPISVENTAP